MRAVFCRARNGGSRCPNGAVMWYTCTMRLILAPMAGLSHEGLRRAAARFGGCDEYYTEMIQAGTLLCGGPFEQYYMRAGPEPDRLVWQITGSKTEHIARAAAMLCGIGGKGIDINMGCCAPDIYRHGAGIAWMLKDPRETAALVAAVRNAVSASGGGRLSVKIRLGREGFRDEEFFSFCDMLASEGVQVITLHPRTLKEKYRQPPRWEYVQRLAEFLRGRGCRTEVVLNGAVCSVSSLRAALSAAPDAAGVMIGREAVKRPWVFNELACSSMFESETKKAPPASIDVYETALVFLSDLEECQPREFFKTRSQRFFTYYCDNVLFAQHLRTELLNSASLEQVRERLACYFEQVPEDRFIPFS